MGDTFHRCRHCRGFYETSLPQCKWCSYATPVLDSSGRPRVYPDRETVRAVQLAEYEQLPAEVRESPMAPPANNLTLQCECLHCVPGAPQFEAIEMRWMANENMWACPCTTCGGRGFGFDIHTVERVWQCAECGHWYTPEKFTYQHAKCPKCGSTYANGWFDDEDEEDVDLEAEADLPSAAPPTGADPANPGSAKADLSWLDQPHPFGDGPDDKMTEPPRLDDIDHPNPGIPPREPWQDDSIP